MTYIILWWKDFGNFLTAVKNRDGSIIQFNDQAEADKWANESPYSDDMRVIDIDKGEAF